MGADRFRRAEEEYLRLKADLAAGKLTTEHFLVALKTVVVRDEQGRAWMPGAVTGRWHLLSGTSWQPADPYRTLRYAARLARETQAGERIVSSTVEPTATVLPESLDIVGAASTGPVELSAEPAAAEAKVQADEAEPEAPVLPVFARSSELARVPSRSRPSRSNLYLWLIIVLLALVLCLLIFVGLVFLTSQGVIKLALLFSSRTTSATVSSRA